MHIRHCAIVRIIQWLIVICICQINSHRSRVQVKRLHVNFRVVCKISYRWGRLSAWCLHMRVFVFLERILTMGVTILFIPLNEVVWSNSCDQFVPGLHIRHAGHGQCMLDKPMCMASRHCVPQPRLRWVTVLPVGDHTILVSHVHLVFRTKMASR